MKSAAWPALSVYIALSSVIVIVVVVVVVVVVV